MTTTQKLNAVWQNWEKTSPEIRRSFQIIDAATNAWAILEANSVARSIERGWGTATAPPSPPTWAAKWQLLRFWLESLESNSLGQTEWGRWTKTSPELCQSCDTIRIWLHSEAPDWEKEYAWGRIHQMRSVLGMSTGILAA